MLNRIGTAISPGYKDEQRQAALPPAGWFVGLSLTENSQIIRFQFFMRVAILKR
jgi:hypothetical protein